MPCYRPIPALQDRANNKPRLWPPLGTANLELPCGKCIGCRAAKATQWARRCEHEAAQWEHNTFVTLTYSDENLPQEGHLQPRDLQLFFKRLRKHSNQPSSRVNSDRRYNLRYLSCGEYGTRNGRPHYHALIFNCGFSDQERAGGTNDNPLYTSETLGRLWPHGSHTFGVATPAAANYIAQYNLKKQGQGTTDEDGVWRPAPFLRVSLRPAIGKEWLDKYAKDLQKGFITQDGQKQPIPRYYTKKLKEEHTDYYENLELNNEKTRIRTPRPDNTEARRKAAEIIHTRLKQLTEKRSI